ncbi:MAG: hypothetical protein JRJ87_20990 [Deltaproteobacteria bacterium]|nr:hypothetical protein [Deltaproteobacteria bacterium]
MDFSHVLGWVLLTVLAVGSGVIGGAMLHYWRQRKQLADSTNYLLDRLKVAESDINRLQEETFLLREYLNRRGLLDEDDLALLRKELIELPRQLEAERAELLKGALKKDEEERLVKNIPDTLH